jgi:hypothetical protein
MLVTVQFNTEDESELALLQGLLGVPEPAKTEDGPKKAEEDAPAPKKVTPAKKAPKVTLEDAVAAAHAKVAENKKYKIAEALKAVDGERVSTLEPGQIEEFMAVLNSEDEEI